MPAQSHSTTAFAKSTRPEIGGVVQREGLFARLDGSAARTVAWISAPAGFGKTTLAASYLEARSYRWAWYQVDADDDDGETFFHYLSHAVRKLRASGDPLPTFGPEHRADVAAFSRRYFRSLFAGAKGPIALVLDDVHELASESPLHAILDAGLAQIPRQCCVILTSRSVPPAALSRLQLAGQMVAIGVDELRFSTADLEEMLRLRGGALAPAALQRLNERAGGWAAALVLMIEHEKLAASRAEPASEATPHAVFDYFAGQVFERFDAGTQRLLLLVACLPRVTIRAAETISGQDGAARILFNLAHNDYFVREIVGAEGRVFVFHPLLREFLLQRAERDLPDAVGASGCGRAAALLRQEGQIEDAMTLFVAGGDWGGAALLAAEEADALLAQGRHATLAAWLEFLPPSVLAGDPRLLRAEGEALAHASPRAARRSFEAAFERFRDNDVAGERARCCVGIVATILREFDDLAGLDRWLAEHERCWAAAFAASADAPAIAYARLWRRAGATTTEQHASRHSRASGWQGELADALAATLDGEFARVAGLVAKGAALGDADSAALAAVDALRLLLEGRFGVALAVARAAIERSAREAVHDFDAWLRLLCAAAAIGDGDAPAARRELDIADTACTRRGDRALHHFLSGALAELEGNASLALREAKSATLLALEVGLPWLESLARSATAQRLASAGDATGAQAQMRSARALAETLASPLLHLCVLFTAAVVARASADAEAGQAIETALSLAQRLGASHVPGVRPTLIAELCASALRRGRGVDQARSLIGAARLAPPLEALRLRQWPWPFEVTTLGGFGLQRGGEPVEFSAKGPGRPVELLKVLLSLGAQNVRADQLADALWPHVDADYAYKSFTATLHRLRRIFGGDDTLRLSDGRLSLNTSLFWLDTWALDQVLADIDTCLREMADGGADTALRALVDEAAALYRGPFLADAAEQLAFLARREQIRARMLRALTRAARHWESLGKNDFAVDFYLRCIDADEQCEAFYRQLMLCHQGHGDNAEARATYARLQAVLAARLKSEPSAETQAVFASLGR